MQTKTPVKWEEKTLGELCISIDDGDWIESKNQSSEGIRLVQTGNVGNGFFKNKGEKAKFISEETFKKLNCMEIFENDCLVSRLPDPIGRACLIPKLSERMITAVDCAILKFNLTKILPQYFVYYSLSNKYLSDVKSHSSGATRQRISRTNLATINIPITSIDEQQRIVEILDKAFEDIEQMKENVKQNLQNAKDLFESYLNNFITDTKMNYKTYTLKELTSLLGDGIHGTPKYDLSGDYFFINGNNLNQGKIEIKQETKRVSKKEYLKHKKNLTDRTVLVSINGTIGNVAFYNNEPVILGKSACYFNLLEKVDKEYIKQLIKSNYFIDYANHNASEMTIKNVSLASMRAFPVPLPPIEIQQEIAKKLNDLQEETKQLEQIYQQKIEQTEELKQSILQKAFNGEL